MKITADGILGSAQKISNKRKVEDGEIKKDKSGLKTDSLSIGKAINSRIETIEREIKDIQTSLTKNQIISDGIDSILKKNTPENTDAVLNNTTFDGRKILKEYLGQDLSSAALETKKSEIKNLINSDINNLTRVQVEVDNIVASNLAGGKKVESLVANVNDIFKNTPSNLDTISSLDADKVMKLVR